ncbi:hypothetical protein [Caulobacter sp. RHG1]|uniref:hypothetical protein n=1 Tax=Caulobacter sp. (strain RHG1) TaxID=2545762 RepID=UPI0015557131|nr:hypothetical protein [Caulobacter sp. RHG1]NQE61398.1 hypothetical protein [Caulobacter sp. RHG1]
MAAPLTPPTSSQSLDPAHFGFDLNSREWASLIYLGFFAVWALSQRKIRQSALNIAKIILGPKLGSLFAIMTLYVVAMVAVLWALNAWEASNLKTTLFWWLTVGFTAVSKAVEIPKDPTAVRRMAGEAIAWTEIILFLGEVHTLPLWGELLLLPALTLLGLLLIVAQSQSEHAILVGPLTKLQIWAGLAILVFSLIGVIKDPDDFLTWNNLREFAVPIILSLAFIPFLLVLAVVMEAESETVSLTFRGHDRAFVGFVQRQAFLAFGVDFAGARRLTRDIKLRDITDRAGVRAAIAEIKAVARQARHPPPIDRAVGWSPFLAASALASQGLAPGDYHRAFGSWSAQAQTLKMGQGPWRPSVSYSVTGNQEAATRLRLQLKVNQLGHDAEIEALWRDLAQALVGWALGEAAVADLTPRLLSEDPQTLTVEGVVIHLSWSRWGTDRLGGWDRILAITHPAHVDVVFDGEAPIRLPGEEQP